ncbi:23S rRNA (uridine-2'-O-) methyltransferase [Natrialba magadii ATCC 43099]|uniref:Ribosomal RNA large subunit methyltransferase E n=1 Tax=Natrialba magadii (strain ATCC 43099 / DSM 3394 / CCM 3739 / CIP 104546 / IAM 13178 / JCM 8861 / NBRC 102185 / NCIMB 2190 / MS3) TaxID=547559 RepID=D3SVL0_NATMM|nr:23S rRNA (uridine(2552)-2'-O)-methyltransferase [Natrialba magadii]ADD05618.1 23S rRNA (uridine-2'-O-) methyltransferase [Natrialba magadii ATCC 43099]ELY29969.1 23S rRNA methyltransferase J [Natrialba magadii ATCC 43099]
MARKDHYYNKAKQEGYRSRAAYKLKQLDQLENVISGGDTVVDLGAAPGGWLEVAAEAVGPQGQVIGVDLQRIRDFDDHDTIETLRGDMTEERTRERVIEAAGGDVESAETATDAGTGGPVDVVISDMAPNMSGEYSLDQARSLHLARQAFETALELLATDGDFIVKVFEGPDVDDFRADVEEEFQYVRATSPKASRDESSEIYFIGKGRLTAPVSSGEELEVEIVDTGTEGDGIASVEGYRLFVPGTAEGDVVTVRVGDVKPNFGFAERIDEE